MFRSMKKGATTTLSLLVVLILLMLPNVTPVLANGGGYGNVQGNVQDANTGSPIAGAKVMLFDAATFDPNTSVPVAESGSTGGSGNYLIFEAPAGDYIIAAKAPGYITEFYPEATRPEDAVPQTLTADGLININFTLEQGGAISGMVFNEWGGTEQNQVVSVWTADTLQMVSWTFSSDFQDHGSYNLGDLPFGDYKVSAGGPLPEGVQDPGNRNDSLMRGWWSPQGTVNSPDAAGIVSVTDPTPVENIDFNLKQGGTFEGRIVGENWNGLDGATITLENYDTGEVIAVATSYNRDGTNPGYSNPGYYRFSGLSSAITYRVWATAPTRVIRYAQMHSSGTYNRDAATKWRLQSGESKWLNDISLPYGGSISGSVFESDGTTPVASVTVVVESWNMTGGDDMVRVTGTTDATGSYTVSGIPLNSYMVSALSAGFSVEYYAAGGSVIDLMAAEEVIVSPGAVNVTGINFALDPGGTISGNVYNSNQQPLEGSKVLAIPGMPEEAQPQVIGGEEGGLFESPFTTVTDASGAYTIIGLPFGDYNVRAQGGANPQYVSEWYDDQLLEENATTITVAAEASEITGIDFSLAVGGSITGIVTPDGGDQWLNETRIIVTDYDTGRLVAVAGILEDNISYLVQGLPAGTYRVMARAHDRARVFWNDTISWDAATAVQVNPPGVVANIKFSLPPGGKISGRVQLNSFDGPSQPLPGALVTAVLLNPLDVTDESFEDTTFTTIANETGDWQFDSLPFGDYKVGARGGEGQIVIPKWWSDTGDAHSFAEAGVHTLDEFNRGWWTDFWLDPAGLVMGSVFQENGTTPVAGAEVFAIDPWFDPSAPPPPGGEGDTGILGAAQTKADGSFDLFVRADGMKFVVGAQAEGRVRKFFQDTFDPQDAMEFQVTQGQEIAGINFNLGPAGTISGTIYDADTSAALDGCLAVAVDETTGVKFEAPTDELGAYTIDNLPHGEYIVIAMGMPDDPLTSNYAREWWQEAASHDAATPVTVSASAPDVSGIDFTLEPGGAINGVVRYEWGGDIDGALVNLYLPDGTLLTSTQSRGWEGYEFRGVPSGTYYVRAQFIDPKRFNNNVSLTNTQRVFYDSKGDFASADPVTVNAPNVASNIDFTLPQARGRISGLIIYSGTFQPADYEQVVVVAQPMDAPYGQNGYVTSIASPGTYEINNIPDGTYVVVAFLDVDGAFQPDSGEPYGIFGEPTPVVIQSSPENPEPQVIGTTVIITDEAKGIISGHVTLESSEDNSGATVSAGAYQTTTSAEGNYMLNVIPGSYTVTITKDNYLPAVSPEVYVVDVLGGEPTEMTDVLLLLGDANADSSIDVADLALIAENMGTAGPTGDVSGDGAVDILDLTAVGRNFGATESLWLEADTTPYSPEASTPTVTISPATQEVIPGTAAVVSVTVADAAGVFAAESHLTFDVILLQVTDADASLDGVQISPANDLFPYTAGAYYNDGLADLYQYSYSAASGGYFVAQNQADNVAGTIDYTVVLLAPADGSDSSVTADSAGASLASVSFNTLDEGEALVDFAAAPRLTDIVGDDIPVSSFTGGSITLQIPPPEVSDIIISNVADKSFSVSWITNVDTTGQISWGTSPTNLSNTAFDDRGELTEDDTHHVTISGLAADTEYFFDVISADTTDDNAGAHYSVTTGPSLLFAMPEIVSGTAYLMDGTTPAEGAIVYLQIGTSSSQVLSGLTDANGSWGVDIAPVRAQDFQSYYAHTDADDLVVNVQGSAQGTATITTTIGTALTAAPDLVLVPNWAPTVENVTASQDAGTGIVSIEYDVSDQDVDDVSADVSFAFWNGTSYVAATMVTGDGAHAMSTTPTHYTATWNAATDFSGQYMTDAKVKVIADDGNVLGAGEGISADFTLDTAGPAGVAPNSPTDLSTDVELSPTFTATAATDPSEPVTYNFIVTRDESFSTGIQQSGWISATSWVPTSRLQAPEITHWWKVQARDSFGNVTESAVYSLTTLAVIPVDVELVDGWNIVAMAVEPAEALTASTLAADINSQGGTVSQVFWWNAAAGSWDFYLVDAKYGTDFDIEIGYGYLLKNAGAATWTYWGTPTSADYYATVEPRITNVADKSFSVSWISQNAEAGQVNWGTSPETLDHTTNDDRGPSTTDDTHHATVAGLAAETTYYFEVVSGGVTYNNGGAPYEVTTGPSLTFTMPEMISGTVYKTNGVTPAAGTIVYAQIGASGSQMLSALVDSSGTWGLNISPARTTDFLEYFAHADTDEMNVQFQGAADGIGSQTVTILAAKSGAPSVSISLSAEVALVDGWNLIALPVEPVTTYTASTMAAEINGQGGGVTQVFWWNAAGGSWDFYLVDAKYGTNFTIELGEGYLLNNTVPVNWAVAGN